MLILWFFSFVLYAHTVTHSEGPSSSALTKALEIIYTETLRALPNMCFHVCTPVSQYIITVSSGGGRKGEKSGNLEK